MDQDDMLLWLCQAGLELEAARRVYVVLDPHRVGAVGLADLRHALCLALPTNCLDAFKAVLQAN